MALQPATSPRLDAEVHGLRARIAELEAWNHAAERAADALNRSGDAFHRIFDHSNDGILVIDGTGERIVDANPRAMEMLGYDRATLLASPLSSLYPDDPERVRALTREVLERGAGATREFDCQTPAGSGAPPRSPRRWWSSARARS
jgi:PAS domain S-box-containing protein